MSCDTPCFVQRLCKDAVSVIDLRMDWSDLLDTDDVLASSVWQYDPQDGDDELQIIETEATDEDKLTRIRISSGTPGKAYRLCNIVTSEGGLKYRRCYHIMVYTHEGLVDYE